MESLTIQKVVAKIDKSYLTHRIPGVISTNGHFL